MSEAEQEKVTRVPVENQQTADGVWVTMRGRREYRLAPLSFKNLRDLQDEVKKLELMSGIPDATQLDVITRSVTASIAWNYPSMKPEYVEEQLLDLGNFLPVWQAMLGTSRVKVKPPGEPVSAKSP